MNSKAKKILKFFLIGILGVVFFYAGAWVWYIYSIDRYHKLTDPCEPLSIRQEGGIIKFICGDTNHVGNYEVDYEQKKINFFLQSGKTAPDEIYTISAPENTKGYQLCYKNSYGEYCFDRIK